MPFRKSPPMDRMGIESMAEGWGKVVARRVHEAVGPDLDLDAEGLCPTMNVCPVNRRLA